MRKLSLAAALLATVTAMNAERAQAGLQPDADIEARIRQLLQQMTLAEKVGQMNLVNGAEGRIPDELAAVIRDGAVGAILNEVDADTVNELQRIAVEESRLGIPLLIGRDVIHGFRTIFPIPLGQAATWNPELVRLAARVSAIEAASAGVNWTYAPMIDVSRDPRWGRIAESFGEDTFLTNVLGVAAVQGYQGDDLSSRDALAACAKHFVGYGASESGRDYNTTNIPDNELWNVYLPPFRAAIDAGAASVMTSFSDLDGVPATANGRLLNGVLRDRWNFDGFVVSDWGSVQQLSIHGLTSDDRESAFVAATAGVDMEMASSTYRDHLAGLVGDGMIDAALLDERVANILRIKLRLGLLENPYVDPGELPAPGNEQHLVAARDVALQSIVLLQNRRQTLPLAAERLKTLAIIGPMADAPYEQLGTWVFDGDPSLSRTPLQSIRERAGAGTDVLYSKGMQTTRSRPDDGFAGAVETARDADAVVVFLGEESILSGEAHSRADIGLPGDQLGLVRALRRTGKPLIAVIMAGRPLTLSDLVEEVDAILFAWHPGTMGGPAIADLLFGIESPSGKLPASFPGHVGQVPIYYAHKNTGKPASPETFVHIDDIEEGARQTSFGMTSFHLDAGYTPLFPFGYGLSYARFVYSDIRLDRPLLRRGESLYVRATVTNEGSVAADEVVQLYVRDRVGSVTRPVRELKGFRRIRLQPGERIDVSFALTPGMLAFHDRDLELVTEPGDFDVWIGGDSTATLTARFTYADSD
ncbi:MAG: beta-glucosidase BglX [Gammaproteobacteria bacterium]|nr:beta-glucosidase BglX [Gammaproteobacteria bacterium]MDH4256203.1 beta-glucosidase BglX [Gammaproteobacteria bacterium]MDH5311669.1 beta-glucosidase BglX [Gammaproteobacteria bacterium]